MIETLIILIIIGILSAVAAPSFLAIFNSNKVDNALSQVRGALQEAQRVTISKNTSCTITLNNNQITGPCLITGSRTIPSEIVMKNNGVGGVLQIQFGIRGNTTFTLASSSASPTDTSAKIVVYKSDNSTKNIECVAISSGVGIIRAGNYSGPTDTAAHITDNGACIASY